MAHGTKDIINDLKSSLDRFIVNSLIVILSPHKYLKSSLDRFIVIMQFLAIKKIAFKIQFG